VSKSCPEFDFLLFKIMAGPSKTQNHFMVKNYPSYCIILNPVVFWRVNLVMIVIRMWTYHQVVSKRKFC
jgi:hypothetical protein